MKYLLLQVYLLYIISHIELHDIRYTTYLFVKEADKKTCIYFLIIFSCSIYNFIYVFIQVIFRETYLSYSLYVFHIKLYYFFISENSRA